MSEGLRIELEAPLPASLPAGKANALFCHGACNHPRERVVGLSLLVGGTRHRPEAWGMPRGAGPGGAFWTTLPIPPLDAPGELEVRAAARLESGMEMQSLLGRIAIVEPERHAPAAAPPRPPGRELIAVCMGTFDPDPELFRRQIESLRAQTDRDWVCLISDDRSSGERFSDIERVVAGDPRFVVSRSEERLGFYRNFERTLGMLPPEARLVALCDQDDSWHSDKLEVLRAELGGARLVYSDQRLVDVEGRVLRDTLWRGRSNNHTSLVSMLVANTVTGAAALFRREVAELALPFPEVPGWQFHDHWIGLVALASGDLRYVDRPMYDYTQHSGAVFGHVSQGEAERRDWRSAFRGWRASYFYGYLPRAFLAQVLLSRCSAQLAPNRRRALERFLACERSMTALAWLALRPLRLLAGRTETLGGEAQLARGVLWRRLLGVAARRPWLPGARRFDAGLPGLLDFEQRRLRRWRARP